MHRFTLLVGLGAVALGVFAQPALSAQTQCVGTLPPGTYEHIVVPSGAGCLLTSSTVTGNVTALEGSSLTLNGNRIGGNVSGHRPSFVGSMNDVIGGNFHVTGATGPGFVFGSLSVNVFACGSQLPTGNVHVKKTEGGTIAVGTQIDACPGNTVGGNIKVEDNLIPPTETLVVSRNAVGGHVHVSKNIGGSQKTVFGNIVSHDLVCRDNDEPFVGGPNTARRAVGQCFAGP